MWYCARSRRTKPPWAWSTTVCSISAMPSPIVMAPMSCDLASVASRIRPAANTPSGRATRTSPVSASTRTSANCAPNACRAKPESAATSSAVSALPMPVSFFSRSSHAFTTAEPQLAVLIDPPASQARGRSLSPSSTRTRSGEVPRVSAAIWVSTVRAPVPMSAAAMRMTKPPSPRRRGRA